ncbi:MAG: hypothetical protein DHS20C13_03530 [Thermodesulfobacteriota bacterium]|nr:MAG: hypothetical protein DHS20C13_03530 [Thermodesulfobacteriota bacterium]
MGKGVNDNETFSALLENMLNKNGGRYEVINCGIDSYSPVLQYLQLKEKIDLINPDLVILNFDMSDLVQEYVYRKSGSFDEDGNIIAVNGIEKETKDPVFKRLRGWIYSNMLTVSIIHQYIYYESYASELMNLENLVARPSTKLLEHTLKIYDDQEFNELFGLVKQSMMEIKKLCETKGCEYIITTYPWGHQVNNWEWVPGRYEFVPKSHEISDRTVIELEKFTQQNDLPFLNTFPDFRSYQGKDPLYYKYDMHWTEAGHEVMALSINNFLDNYINSSEYNK